MDTPALKLFRTDEFPVEYSVECPVENLPVRGVGWVLGWAGTLAILGVSAVILTSFAFPIGCRAGSRPGGDRRAA